MKATNAVAALFTSLIASLRVTRQTKQPTRIARTDTIRKSGPRIDARRARRSGKTTHRQQKRERMAALREALPA